MLWNVFVLFSMFVVKISTNQGGGAVVKRGLSDKASRMAKFTGERAMIDAKMYNQPIIYVENGKLVKEYPNGYKEMTERASNE